MLCYGAWDVSFFSGIGGTEQNGQVGDTYSKQLCQGKHDISLGYDGLLASEVLLPPGLSESTEGRLHTRKGIRFSTNYSRRA